MKRRITTGQEIAVYMIAAVILGAVMYVVMVS
jgi:hypothetical protein